MLKALLSLNLNILMSTESPSTIQQTAAILTRLNRHIATFLDISQTTYKKDAFLQNRYSPLYQLSAQTESLVKKMMKRMNDCEKSYEQQLQKLQDRQRKHAKNHCEMKLYCQFLEQELRGEKNRKKQYQAQLEFLTVEYNKQIETLKTQLSNAIVTRMGEEQTFDARREESKQSDILSKIKRRLLNIGNVQMCEQISCINTVREGHRQVPDYTVPPHPYSQPNSFHNSPVNSVNKQEIMKQVKMKKPSSKVNKNKKKSGSKIDFSSQRSKSHSKLKTFKHK